MDQANFSPVLPTFVPPPLPPARPTSSWSWLRAIHDRNPCFLLSAVSMLVGCRLVSDAVNFTGDVGNIVSLLAAINLYEFALIGLGAYLLVRRGLQRDGRILLTLAALFLVDIVFLNGTIATAGAGWGLAVNVALLALAGAKTWIVLRALGVRDGGRTLALILCQVAALLAGPTAFKQLAMAWDGFLPPLVVYCGWWVAGATLVLAATLRPVHRRHTGPTADRAMVRVYVAIPFCSLLAHLYAAGWVYKIPFDAVNVAPLLLAAALYLGAARPLPWPTIVRVQGLLAAAAILVSAGRHPHLLFLAPGGITISPLRLALIGTGLVCLQTLYRAFDLKLALAAIATLAAALLGHNLAEIARRIVRAISAAIEGVDAVRPRTPTAWGVAAIVGAFLLLAIGGAVSLWWGRADEPGHTEAGVSPNPKTA